MTNITVKSLTEEDKDSFVRQYERKTIKMKDLAKLFNTSPRTLNRVLEERGLLTPVPRLKGEAHQVMQLLAKYSIGVNELEQTLNTPALTPMNVQAYLNNCSKEQLATHFYTSGLTKLAEIAKSINASKQNAVAAPIAVPA